MSAVDRLKAEIVRLQDKVSTGASDTDLQDACVNLLVCICLPLFFALRLTAYGSLRERLTSYLLAVPFRCCIPPQTARRYHSLPLADHHPAAHGEG